MVRHDPSLQPSTPHNSPSCHLQSPCLQPLCSRCRFAWLHCKSTKDDECVASLRVDWSLIGETDAQNKKSGKEYLHEIQKKAKILEINPRSPLIEGLLRRVERVTGEDSEQDPEGELEAELKEVASILIDGALIRSGFEVPDTNK